MKWYDEVKEDKSNIRFMQFHGILISIFIFGFLFKNFWLIILGIIFYLFRG